MKWIIILLSMTILSCTAVKQQQQPKALSNISPCMVRPQGTCPRGTAPQCEQTKGWFCAQQSEIPLIKVDDTIAGMKNYLTTQDLIIGSMAFSIYKCEAYLKNEIKFKTGNDFVLCERKNNLYIMSIKGDKKTFKRLMHK